MSVFRRVRERADEESGATLVMFALSLIVLLGMVALVVDGGGMFVAKRRVVAGADAAALAAAQSCASSQPAQAPSEADRYATMNVPGARRTGYEAQGCGATGPGSAWRSSGSSSTIARRSSFREPCSSVFGWRRSGAAR